MEPPDPPDPLPHPLPDPLLANTNQTKEKKTAKEKKTTGKQPTNQVAAVVAPRGEAAAEDVAKSTRVGSRVRVLGGKYKGRRATVTALRQMALPLSAASKMET